MTFDRLTFDFRQFITLGMKRFGLILLVMAGFLPAMSQTDWNYSQLLNNPGLVNPSYQGRTSDMTLDAFCRQQWSGVEGAPQCGAFDLNGCLSRKGLTWGMLGQFERENVINRSMVAANMTARIRLSRYDYLVAGIRVGMDMLSYDKAKIIGGDGDIFLAESRNMWISGVGATWVRKELIVGLSALMSMGGSEDLLSFVCHGEYDFQAGRDWTWNVHPMAMIKYHNIWGSYAEVGIRGGKTEFFQVGASYRTDATMTASMDVKVVHCLSVTYSFSLHTGELANLSKNTNEIGVKLNISAAFRGKQKTRYDWTRDRWEYQKWWKL